MVEQNAAIQLHTSALGTEGADISGGIYQEDYLQALRGVAWAREADKMRTQDGRIKMCLGAVLNPIRSCTWEILAADANDPECVKHRDLVEHILFNDLGTPWNTFVNEAFTFAAFGFSMFEKIHKNVLDHPRFGSYTGFKKLAFRSPKTIDEWHVDANTGELQFVVQRAFGDVNKDVRIPEEFLLIFTMDQEGNDYASSTRALLRPCYGNYKIKQFLKKLKSIGHQKMTVGVPHGEIPVGALKEEQERFKKMLELYSTNERQYMLTPAGFKVTILEGKFDSASLEAGVTAENTEMTCAFLENFLNLGQDGAGGAYALGQTTADFFLKGINCIVSTFTSGINSNVVREIVDANFGPQEAYPKLMHGGIEDVGEDYSRAFKNYVDAGAIVVDPTLRGYVRKLMRLPPEEALPTDVDIEEDPTPEPAKTPPAKEPDPADDEPVNTEPAVEEYEDEPSARVLSREEFRALADKPRTIINQGAVAISELMVEHLDTISNKLIVDVINRYKNMPVTGKAKAAVNVKAGGVNAYKKSLRSAIANLSALAINGAREEVGFKKESYLAQAWNDCRQLADISKIVQDGAFAVFNNLPITVRNKIIQLIDAVISTQAGDLERAVKLQFGSSESSTSDPDILSKDMKIAANKVIDAAKSVGAKNLSSQAVNEARLDTFFDDEISPAVQSFTFMTAEPNCPICDELSDRTFELDDAESLRYTPPLHHNCDCWLRPNLREKLTGTVIPVYQDNPKAPKPDPLGLRSADPDVLKKVQFSECKCDLPHASVDTPSGAPKDRRLAQANKPTLVQAISFDKVKFTRDTAKQWARYHSYKDDEIEEDGNWFTMRQRKIEEFDAATMTRSKFAPGIEATLGKEK